jgi:hypothetical protein
VRITQFSVFVKAHVPQITMRGNSRNPQQPVYTCSCGPAFESSCPFFNRCLEPLAWSLDPSTIPDQPNSPLYTTLPKELRDMIFAYALTDTTSYPVDCEPAQHEEDRRSRRAGSSSSPKLLTYPSDIAFGLVQTCKAVYSETYTHPLSLNAYIVPSLNDQVKQCRFLPWQLGLITHLDITLPQMALEGGEFSDALKVCHLSSPIIQPLHETDTNILLPLQKWAPDKRSHGAYTLPNSWLHDNTTGKITNCPVFFDTVLLPAVIPIQTISNSTTKHPHRLSPLLQNTGLAPNFPFKTSMRVTRAHPLTHLTLRLRARDWWTWSDAPSPSAKADPTLIPHNELHLEPLIGDGYGIRGSSTRMRQLSDERRTGLTPSSAAKPSHVGRGGHPIAPTTQGWGNAICTLLPDIKSLELVLETFKVKETQLDSVAECAQTWEFPISGRKEKKLVWDGEVVEKRWSRSTGGLRLGRDASWDQKCDDFEVRVVRYVRKKTGV